MELTDLFKSKSRKLYWKRLPISQVEDDYQEIEILPDEAYLILRLKEMYLHDLRVLWRKFYPLLHGFVKYGDKENHGIVGPGQLSELGEANLDRIVNLNKRLTDLIPFKGGDVEMLAGLYAVPGQDAARILIDTLSEITKLGGLAISEGIAVAGAVKNGVESVLQLDQTQLQLGVNDTFYPSNPLRSGFYLGVNTEAANISLGRLWMYQGRLLEGEKPFSASPFDAYDYMLLEIERRDRRDDWPGLPGVGDFNPRFSQVMANARLTIAQKRACLRDLWPEFTQALADSPFLVRPDRERIAKSVSDDLNARLTALEIGNPFELRTLEGGVRAILPAHEFDLAFVPDTLKANDPQSLMRAKQALSGNPFGG